MPSRDAAPSVEPGRPVPDADAALSFGRFVLKAQAAGKLVVQPRMGFSTPEQMRAGLLATKAARAHSVGTITVDSYTRLGDERSVLDALGNGDELNGYPITSYPAQATRQLQADIRDSTFPVQVRHGSAVPQRIFTALVRAGLDATEGGPVSYCLPYGRTPLAESVANWRECCELLASRRTDTVEPHLETFGGCLLGQLCPPGLLVAVSVLEALFFQYFGLGSISVSYAQQTNFEQDHEALVALRRLGAELLSDSEWHIVLYTYMGRFPRSPQGAIRLLEESAYLAVSSRAARLIVKTTAEAHRIPTIAENVQALEIASTAAQDVAGPIGNDDHAGSVEADSAVYREARTLVEAVRELDENPGRALVKAFSDGYLDIPYCLHPDNAGRSRSSIDASGRLIWSDTGGMPIRRTATNSRIARLTSQSLIESLSYVQNRFDRMDGGTAPSGVSINR